MADSLEQWSRMGRLCSTLTSSRLLKLRLAVQCCGPGGAWRSASLAVSSCARPVIEFVLALYYQYREERWLERKSPLLARAMWELPPPNASLIKSSATWSW